MVLPVIEGISVGRKMLKSPNEGYIENTRRSCHLHNLPDESHPQIEVDNIFFGLRNDVHQLVLRLIDPALHLINRTTKYTTSVQTTVPFGAGCRYIWRALLSLHDGQMRD